MTGKARAATPAALAGTADGDCLRHWPLILAALLALCLTIAPPAHGAPDCAGGAGSWQPHEAEAWAAAKAGRPFPAESDADLAPFISRVLLCEQLVGELTWRGLEITDAAVGSLDLSHARIGARFACHRCRFGALHLERSGWARDVDLSGSTFAGALDMTGASFRGGLVLDGTQLLPQPEDAEPGEISLRQATVEGPFSMRDAVVNGVLALSEATISGDALLVRTVALVLLLDGAVVKGDAALSESGAAIKLSMARASIGGVLDLHRFEARAALEAQGLLVAGAVRLDRSAFSSVLMEDARIGQHVVLSAAAVEETVDLDHATIGGDLWIRAYEGAPPPRIGLAAPEEGHVLSLRNAEIKGRIDAIGAEFGGGVNLDAARIGEDLWLRRGTVIDGPVDAPYARIGQNVDLSGATLGSIDATGSQIGGELRLGAPGTATLPPPVWRDGATLTLRNARVSAWVDGAMDGSGAELPCEQASDPWPREIDVIGFAYERIGGLGGGAAEARERCRWYVGWLARQEPFSLDPYRRLADYLDAGGRATAARQVRWAAKERQLEEATGLEFWRLFLQRIFVGYGIYTYIVFLWLGAFVILGRIVFSLAPEAKSSPVPLGYVFSLDMLLPFLSFRKAHGDVDLESPFRYYLYFHKFMGWVFALFFVSALGGLFAV